MKCEFCQKPLCQSTMSLADLVSQCCGCTMTYLRQRRALIWNLNKQHEENFGFRPKLPKSYGMLCRAMKQQTYLAQTKPRTLTYDPNLIRFKIGDSWV